MADGAPQTTKGTKNHEGPAVSACGLRAIFVIFVIFVINRIEY
jgi:hypothetical protein